MVNQALREYVETQHEPLEETLRRVLREVWPETAGRKRAATKEKPASKKRAK